MYLVLHEGIIFIELTVWYFYVLIKVFVNTRLYNLTRFLKHRTLLIELTLYLFLFNQYLSKSKSILFKSII